MTEWVLGVVGDVFINRHNSERAFKYSAEALQQIDVVSGNCEGAYSDSPHWAPSAGRWRVVAKKKNGEGLREAGFDVMSCANNHILDGGHEGLIDTLSALNRQGIQTVGAGPDFDSAHAPAFVDCSGQRVGFLAYSSVYPAGYEARKGVPGLAAIRVHSHYYIPHSNPYGKVEPGATPSVRTFPFPEDLDKLRSDISAARTSCGVVVVNFHWGQASEPASLTDYEKTLGRIAIDYGADVVVGHHHHFLRGVEIYHGKPIYYGVGHFVFDLPVPPSVSAADIEKMRNMGEFAIYPREGYPLLPFHRDARMTMIAVCFFKKNNISSYGFIPCLIDNDNHAVPVDLSSSAGKEILTYVQNVSRHAGLNTGYRDLGVKIGKYEVVSVTPQ